MLLGLLTIMGKMSILMTSSLYISRNWFQCIETYTPRYRGRYNDRTTPRYRGRYNDRSPADCKELIFLLEMSYTHIRDDPSTTGVYSMFETGVVGTYSVPRESTR